MRLPVAFSFLTIVAACSLSAPGDRTLSGGKLECGVNQKSCETDCASLDEPATGCGMASCAPCALPHAQPLCTDGNCAIGACQAGWGDCDGVAETGCEAAVAPGEEPCSCHAMRFVTPQGSALMDITTAVPLGTGDWTVEAWVNITGGVQFFQSQGPLPFIILATRGNPPLFKCKMYDGTELPGVNEATTTKPLVIGTWQHVACIRHGGELQAFVSGRLAATSPIQGNPDLGVQSRGSWGGWSGYPVSVGSLMGPVRISRGARYSERFAPASRWTVDADTLVQYLVDRPASPQSVDRWIIHDEAARETDGGTEHRNDALTLGGLVPEETDTPCATRK